MTLETSNALRELVKATVRELVLEALGEPVTVTVAAIAEPPAAKLLPGKRGRRGALRAAARRVQAGRNGSTATELDAAILKFLERNDGVAMIKQIAKGLQADKLACRRALNQLKADGLVGRTGHTWSLVGAGSTHA